MALLETGLWSSIPDECWTLEMKLSKKQEAEFRLLAPDEPDARAAFEKKHPDKVQARKKLLQKLKPPMRIMETLMLSQMQSRQN